MKPVKDVDEYIEGGPKEVQEKLKKLVIAQLKRNIEAEKSKFS